MAWHGSWHKCASTARHGTDERSSATPARERRGAPQRRLPRARLRRCRPSDEAAVLPAPDHRRGSRRSEASREGAHQAAGTVRRTSNPRTRATVNQLLDRWLEMVELEPTTRAGYVEKIEKRIRPTIGKVEVGKLDAETIDSLYAQLRRCREHCHGRKYVEHRTSGRHQCAERCRPHTCTPLSAGSIRVVHSTLSGSLKRAVRWGTPDLHQHHGLDGRWDPVDPSYRSQGR
ncbi:hypothetical protein [Actinopolymorpha sp. B9G3]|uniref:hypothetical protein n=1 Tax=Actinopolymorpha sp. B9G3 TaxID=3158970 RepID=UPI0032D9A926